MSDFAARYGPWALIAGASAGLGEAFARALAARGLNLLLMARRGDALERLGAELRAAHGVEVRSMAVDLGAESLPRAALALARGVEVGLVVYNAAHSLVGPFLERPLAAQLRVIDVNCRGPLVLAHLFGGPMAERGHGGLVFMTSVAGSHGNPLLASYAASKAFNLVLAEGLWAELREEGVDVLACRAGAIRTRGFLASRPRREVPLQEPEAVARAALEALGRKPSVVTGTLNRLAAFAFGRLLPRTATIRLAGRATRRLYG